ncbi:zinc metalloproteinase nas-4 isoform X1 [Oryzias melastigma]|uniref:Metalloendopeptidase n=1 Tax=Oryzias melastigma TaxID=30732 RepID=A0A3B3BED4_ORYME|nr:zinc metalloproteinase nas-4 isoform X1 [Oryzias melastigma]
MLLQLLLLLLLAEAMRNVNSGPLKGAKKVSHSKEELKKQHDPETLEEMLNEDYALVEGDILLKNSRNVVGNRWPMLSIPYDISPEINGRTRDILAAMAMVSDHTCLSFHRRNDSQHDYIFFKIGHGCASYVGFRGGAQNVFVAPECSVGNIAHEILHTLGFQHEHTRMDREKYITILTQNIISGMENNFQTYNGETFNLQYDYASIMHYGRKFFSSNGEPTIVPNKDVEDMGQRTRLTPSDIQRVLLLYGCDSLKEKS